MPEPTSTRQDETRVVRRSIIARAGRWLGVLLAATLLLLTLVAAWVSGTTAGLRSVASLASSLSNGALRLQDAEGRLFDRMRFGRVELDLPDLRLRASGVEFEWSPGALLDESFEVDLLSAEALHLATRPGEGGAAGAPPDLPIPLRVRVGELRLGAFVLHDWAEREFGAETFRLDDGRARIEAGPRQIRLEQASLRLPWGRLAARGSLGTGKPFPLELEASLDGDYEQRGYRVSLQADGTLLAPTLALRADSEGVEARATIEATPFEPVPLRQAKLSLGPLDPATFAAQAPAAALQLEATLALAPAATGSKPAPLDWQIEGPVEVVNGEPGRWDQGRLPLERLKGVFHWAGRRLVAEELMLALPGRGRLSGRAEWEPQQDAPAGRFDLALLLEGLRLRALDGRLPEAALAGKVTGSGDAKAQQGRLDIQGEGLTLVADVAQQEQVLRLSKLRLTQGRASVTGEARISLAAPTDFAAKLALRALDPAALYAEAPAGELNLTLDASGRLEPQPLAELSYQFAPSTLFDHALAGQGRLTLSRQRMADADWWLSLGGNRIEARGGWGAEGDRLEVSLEADELRLLDPGLSGTAKLQATLGGTLARPTGKALVTATRLTVPGGWSLAGLNLQGEMDAGLDGPLLLAAGVGEVRGPDRALLLQRAGVSLEGTRGSHRAELSLTAAEGDELDARLEGALAEDYSWLGRLLALQTRGRLDLTLDRPATLALAADAASLGEARLHTGQGGRVTLTRTAWRPAGLDLAGSVSGLGFGLAGHGEDGDGAPLQGELVLGGEWDLQLADSIDGSVRLRRESGDLVLLGDAAARLGLSELEVVANAVHGEVAVSAQVEGAQLGSVSGSLSTAVERVGGGVRLVPGAPLLGSARLDMPSIKWVGPFMNAQLLTEGRLTAAFSISGTPEAPLAVGQLEGSGLELNLPDVGLRLSGGRLKASFDQDYLRIIALEFVSPNRVQPAESRIAVGRLMEKPGRLLASGSIDLSDGAGRFGFRADRLPLLQRRDRWLAVSGEGDVSSGWDFVELKAMLEADAGAITIDQAPPPSLSEDVVVFGEERPAGNFSITADIGIRLGNAFYLTAMGLDTRLAGGIDVFVRPGHPPVASGVISLEDGVFEGYGQKLAVEKSTVNFAGPPDNPSLNITALRKGLEVEAGVSITGTARRPRVQLVSSPNVPDAEKLSWIVLGRPPDTSSSADLGLLIPAAQALLGGPGGGITSQLTNALGFDQFSIGQGDLNSAGRSATSSVVDSGVRSSAGSVSGQVVTLGKRLSADTFLAFEQSLAGAESIVKLTHQLGRRVSVVARGGTNNAVDIYYTFTFR